MLQDEIISKIVAEINEKKELIIKERLKQLDIEIDYGKESERRFKLFLCEIKGDEETIYYNDGTITGFRIVTFVQKHKPIDFNEPNIGTELSYY